MASRDNIFTQRIRSGVSLMAWLCAGGLVLSACAHPQEQPAPRNSLHQETGMEGSTMPRANPPHHPNTSGNIVSPPGNPAGNPAGAPPIVGGTTSQHYVPWPEGR